MASGVAYATLRDLYSGRATNPSRRTLEKIADRYRIELDWLTGRREGEEVPSAGLLLGLTPDADKAPSNLPGVFPATPPNKVVGIPFAAWRFIDLYRRLRDHLHRLPPTKDRPIVGDARTEAEVESRLANFLLAPLIAAHEKVEAEMPLLNPLASRYPYAEDVRKLLAVADMWLEVLADLLPSQRAAP